MPVLTEAPQSATDVERKRWTRDECEELAAAGIQALDRYELIEGELIQKMPKHMPHSLVMMLLLDWLRGVFGVLFVVPEGSVDLPGRDFNTSVPEPDLFVLRRSAREITFRANSQDVLLAIEVSVTTLNFDRTIKAALYARAAIPEYWVVDVNARRIIVHRNPQDGIYQSILTYSENESVSPLAAPNESLPIRNCF